MPDHTYLYSLVTLVQGDDTAKALAAITQLRRQLDEREEKLLKSAGDDVVIHLHSTGEDVVVRRNPLPTPIPAQPDPPALEEDVPIRFHSTGEEVVIRRPARKILRDGVPPRTEGDSTVTEDDAAT